MKKAIAAVVVCVLLAGLGGGWLVWKRTRQSEPRTHADLLPADTLLLVELPDCPRSRARLTETALWQLLHEPEVAAFLQRPKAHFSIPAIAPAIAGEFQKADLRHGFFAVTAIQDNMPHAVGGFEFGGNRKELEEMLAQAEARLRAASPTGKAVQFSHGDYDITSFTAKGVTVAGAFADHWYFFSNNVELLAATLDRFTEKQQGTLAESDAYLKSNAHLPEHADLRVFAQPKPLMEKLFSRAEPRPGSQAADERQLKELRKVQAISAAVQLEGETLHDTVFILGPKAENWPKLNGSTLSLASSSTFLYGAFAPLLSGKTPAQPPVSVSDSLLSGSQERPLSETLSGLFGISNELIEHGLRPEDVSDAVGPEFAITSSWPAGTLRPSLQLAAEVKNRPAAEKLAQALGGALSGEHSELSPGLALTTQFMLLGLDVETLKSAPKTGINTPRVWGTPPERSPALSQAMAAAAKSNSGLFYLDSKALFERAYGWLRPMAMIWANFIPHAADYVDVSKLPPTETISKHLQPMLLSITGKPDGVLLESSGTVTFFEASAVAGAALGAAALPVLDGKTGIPALGSLYGRVPAIRRQITPFAAPHRPAAGNP